MTDGGEWHLVTRMKQKLQRGYKKVSNGRMDVASNGWLGIKGRTVSFFFSDFPETHSAKDMLRAFSYYGKVVEVVIPQKRNKRGLRFGFVKFLDVQEPRAFAIKLDNIIIGAKKIHVNIPRFVRERVAEAKVVNEKQNNGTIVEQGKKMIWRVVADDKTVRREEPTPRNVKAGRSEGGEGEGRGKNFMTGRNGSKKWVEKKPNWSRRLCTLERKIFVMCGMKSLKRNRVNIR